MIVSIKAAAKINLHLDIFGTRPDGYHNLLSLMQMVSLYDEIYIRLTGHGKHDSIHGGLSIPLQENTILKAIQVFREKTGLGEGFSVDLTKRIPLGAGLGGGSSDAAAVLFALDLLCETNLNEEELTVLGLRIGSDVPFFLHSAAALVRGRGESVTPVKPRADFSLLLLNPGFPIRTSEAYGWFDLSPDRRTTHPGEEREKEIVESYENDKITDWDFRNSFLEVIAGRYPELERARCALESMGAVCAGLSGSGATLYGIFNDSGEAERVSEYFSNLYPFVKVVEPLEMKPIPVLKLCEEPLGSTG